jgi:hypothetical protein
LVAQLLDSVDIKLDLVEPICFVSFDQELLEESIDLDTATSDLESIQLIPLDLEVLHAESEDLHLVREVVEAQHEVEGLDGLLSWSLARQVAYSAGRPLPLVRARLDEQNAARGESM